MFFLCSYVHLQCYLRFYLFHMSSQSIFFVLLSQVFHNSASKEMVAFSASHPTRVKLVRTGSSQAQCLVLRNNLNLKKKQQIF